ncbi:MAG: hypothetical protein ACI8VI_001064 [Granulosicoccus sp.]|jgi:hypothetical protein
MTDLKKEINNQSNINVRTKPNGSIIQLLTLDPETLLEIDNPKNHKESTSAPTIVTKV